MSFLNLYVNTSGIITNSNEFWQPQKINGNLKNKKKRVAHKWWIYIYKVFSPSENLINLWMKRLKRQSCVKEIAKYTVPSYISVWWLNEPRGFRLMQLSHKDHFSNDHVTPSDVSESRLLNGTRESWLTEATFP